MIKSGALDGFGRGRKNLYDALHEVLEQARRGQMALFNGSEMKIPLDKNSPPLSDWDEYTKLAKEKEVLGFYHSGHPLAEFRAILDELTPGGAPGLQELPADSRGRLGGTVDEIRVTKSRKGEPLHFVRVEDFRGSLEVVVFNDIYTRYEDHLFKGALVLISGRIVKENGQVRLVADEIMPLKEAAVKLATSIHLYLSVEGLSAAALGELRQLLAVQPGSCPVYLHLKIGQKTEVVQRLPSTFSVLPTEDLKKKLTHMFGETCLEVGYSE
jgi:DNA polymerase-3 subunit alpha